MVWSAVLILTVLTAILLHRQAEVRREREAELAPVLSLLDRPPRSVPEHPPGPWGDAA